MLVFNDLLVKASLDLADVRLLRHQTKAPNGRTPYLLWRDRREAFDEYQSVQTQPNGAKLRSPYWASFVAPPSGGTLFTGIYSAEIAGPSPSQWIDPLYDRPGTELAGQALDRYETHLLPLLEKYVGRLWIDWGAGTRSWIQRADRQVKGIVELTREFKEEQFPGFTHFISNISDVPSLPRGWIDALAASRGIYLLTSERTREWYVGSATSREGGFISRWQNYASDGHGGNIGLKSAEPSDYQVTILEVSGSAASADEIVQTEQLWKRKLQSRGMGLNRN
jgi:hypothetical protein